MQCHLRAQRASTFNWAFLPCPTCTVISLDSLNLFTILCMVLGEMLCNFAFRNVIFDLFDTSLVKFGTKWWAMIQLCLQRLRCSFYTQTWYLDLLPIHLPYELFQNSLTWIFYNLFTFILPLSQLFWNVLQPSKTFFFIFTNYIYFGQWKL